ncbi:MAG TPA: hypothetical protein VJ992_01625 [Gemmatimonadales bacterium]|nr:hypothetical protein [Gemmatimonadales bacterium]
MSLALLLSCVGNDGAFPGCPADGRAKRASIRALNLLKNRRAAPAAADIDASVTLERLLAPGNDRHRWNTRRAATVVGYVRDVEVGGVETVNCSARAPRHRDTHIELVIDGAHRGQLPLIVEVTPWWRSRVARAGLDWSTDALRSTLLGRRVRVTGWLLFDAAHRREAENTAPGRSGDWRGSAWELHPVTALEVLARPPR